MSHWTKENVAKLTREYLGDDDGSPQAKKRSRILAAATRLFMERGYRKTSIDEVARAAGVAKGTVYLYYENKADLLVHAIALEKQALVGRFEPLLTGAIPECERLQRYLEIVFGSIGDLPLVSRLMTGDRELLEALEDLGQGAMEQSRAQSRAWIGELIELAAPGVFTEAERGARADLVAAVQLSALPLLSEGARGAASAEAFQKLLATVLARGLAAGDAPAAPPRAAPRASTRRKSK